MVGIWMQDWVGSYAFDEGTRLLWDWKLNTTAYDDWNGMVDGWAADGVKPFIYINPYFAKINPITTEPFDQWAEGDANGYFVKNPQG